jgi:hypothetical protein
MKRIALIACLLLAACGGAPAPEWKTASRDLLERYSNHALRGESKLAEDYFNQALSATSATGRIGDVARLWLVRCAVETALLDFSDCARYTELARLDPRVEDTAYYRFLQGEAIQAASLPETYADFVNAGADSAKIRAALAAMDDPRSRLIAAGVAVRRGAIDEETLMLAADSASEQGWRRPLLTYLKLLEARLTRRDDPRLPALRKRIELAAQP